MKLIDLIPLREVEDAEAKSPELIAQPFFREFQAKHGYKPLFKYIGTKKEQMIFTLPVTDFGAFELIVKDAQIVAKVTEKEAVFGMIYTLTGLEKFDATICKMKYKKDVLEVMEFDNKDKKDFDAKTTNFIDLFEDQ